MAFISLVISLLAWFGVVAIYKVLRIVLEEKFNTTPKKILADYENRRGR